MDHRQSFHFDANGTFIATGVLHIDCHVDEYRRAAGGVIRNDA